MYIGSNLLLCFSFFNAAPVTKTVPAHGATFEHRNAHDFSINNDMLQFMDITNNLLDTSPLLQLRYMEIFLACSPLF